MILDGKDEVDILPHDLDIAEFVDFTVFAKVFRVDINTLL